MENSEKQSQLTSEKEAIIAESFAEKKGREVNGTNPYTGFVSINSPEPDLALLTASMLERLTENPLYALTWAQNWDKSIISVSPDNSLGFVLLPSLDRKTKSYIPVSTVRAVDSETLISPMPEAGNVVLAVNSAPMTIDAFLISYFHLVNEYIWDRAIMNADSQRVSLPSYRQALELVCENGFSVDLLSETEILKAKSADPRTSIRVYGSGVNSSVPQILGAVINR